MSIVIVACLGAALLLRPSVADFAKMALTAMPSCGAQIDMNNSVQLRSVLLQDALYLLPKAGPFGYGLNAFQDRLTCLRGFAPHVSLLHAGVEFGWLAGLAFAVLLILPLGQLFVVGPGGKSELFIASLFMFTALLTFAHGHISREPVLFLLLGSSAALFARPRALSDHCMPLNQPTA